MSRNENLTRHRRLKDHDYTEPGYYFVTFNTWDRHPHLGKLENGRFIALPIGAFLQHQIGQISQTFPGVHIDCHAVMPDHVHLLIYISLESTRASVPDIVRSLKGRSAAAFRRMVPKTSSKLWQEGFDDRIIRNDKHLDEVRRYIAENQIRPSKDQWW